MIPNEAMEVFRQHFGDAVDEVEAMEPWKGFDVFHVRFKRPMTVGCCTFALGKGGKYRMATISETMELCARN